MNWFPIKHCNYIPKSAISQKTNFYNENLSRKIAQKRNSAILCKTKFANDCAKCYFFAPKCSVTKAKICASLYIFFFNTPSPSSPSPNLPFILTPSLSSPSPPPHLCPPILIYFCLILFQIFPPLLIHHRYLPPPSYLISTFLSSSPSQTCNKYRATRYSINFAVRCTLLKINVCI